jgi:alkanesulfonate monooxygenase SsuD/methylene tetrahydromethanopterin reductase-like flavin-dependent oxidoreductase (luciferase family)
VTAIGMRSPVVQFAQSISYIDSDQPSEETPMKLGLLMPMGSDWRRSVERARIAEGLGYEYIATGEAWGPSVLPWLALVAANTTRIRIGTAIVNCFSRTPATLAQEFAMLDQISGGRAVLGLGSSGAFVVEHLHGIRFEKPLRRIRETVEIFDQLIAGKKLDYEGEIFKLHRGFQLEYARPRNKIPVYIAAITPSSIRQTAEIADGIYPIHWSRHLFPKLHEDLADAARAVGREGARLTVAPFTKVSVLDGRDDEKKWRDARQLLCFYLNQMGVFYWQMLVRNGYEAEVNASRAAFAQRDREGALAAISDRMVRDTQVIGSLEEVREQLRERAALGADLQMIYAPRGDDAAVAKQLEAFVS